MLFRIFSLVSLCVNNSAWLLISHLRPKAGVFAVHQGKPLFKNLQHISSGQPLFPFYPKKHRLSLIGTGYKIESSEKYLQAMIAWGGLCFCLSKLLWFWKESIDRQLCSNFEDEINDIGKNLQDSR